MICTICSHIVMNGIRSLPTSLVCSLTDIFIFISVLLWFSLDLYHTSYPCLPPRICLTRLTSLRHLLARRSPSSRWRLPPLANRSVLTAHHSLLTAHCSLLTAHYSLLTREQPAVQTSRQSAGWTARKAQPIRKQK
jgi:hypothetical protein